MVMLAVPALTSSSVTLWVTVLVVSSGFVMVRVTWSPALVPPGMVTSVCMPSARSLALMPLLSASGMLTAGFWSTVPLPPPLPLGGFG